MDLGEGGAEASERGKWEGWAEAEASGRPYPPPSPARWCGGDRPLFRPRSGEQGRGGRVGEVGRGGAGPFGRGGMVLAGWAWGWPSWARSSGGGLLFFFFVLFSVLFCLFFYLFISFSVYFI